MCQSSETTAWGQPAAVAYMNSHKSTVSRWSRSSRIGRKICASGRIRSAIRADDRPRAPGAFAVDQEKPAVDRPTRCNPARQFRAIRLRRISSMRRIRAATWPSSPRSKTAFTRSREKRPACRALKPD